MQANQIAKCKVQNHNSSSFIDNRHQISDKSPGKARKFEARNSKSETISNVRNDEFSKKTIVQENPPNWTESAKNGANYGENLRLI